MYEIVYRNSMENCGKYGKSLMKPYETYSKNVTETVWKTLWKTTSKTLWKILKKLVQKMYGMGYRKY